MIRKVVAIAAALAGLGFLLLGVIQAANGVPWGLTVAGGLLLLLAAGAAAIFPVALHSTLAPENSLTAYDVAAGPRSLAYAAIWWPIGFALAAAYFVFVSQRYAGKVSVSRDNQGFY